MTILNIVINFGSNTYVGGLSNSFGITVLGIGLSSFLSFIVALGIYFIGKHKERKKEDTRLNDTRMIVYFFLKHQIKALNNQLISLRKAISEMDIDLKERSINYELIDCFKALDILDLDLQKVLMTGKEFKIADSKLITFVINVDIIPNQLRYINANDTFKILLAKDKSDKKERQEVFTQFYHQNELIIKVEGQMEKVIELGNIELNNDLADIEIKVNDILSVIQEQQFLNYEDFKKGLLKDEFLIVIFKIFDNHLNNNTGIIEGLLQHFLIPLKLQSFKFFPNPVARGFAVKVQEIERMYYKVIEKKRERRENMVSWENVLVEALKIMERVLKVEYNKEAISNN